MSQMQSEWVEVLNPEGVKIGRGVKVHISHYPAFRKLLDEYKTNHAYMQLVKRLENASSQPYSGQALNIAATEQSIEFSGMKLGYTLAPSGDIHIHSVDIGDQYADASTGLKRVVYKNNKWIAENNIKEFDLKQKINGAHYVGTAGKFDDLDRAAGMIPDHIEGAYVRKTNKLADNHLAQKSNEYSLYYFNEQKDYKDKRVIEHMADLIKQAHKSGVKVHWLVHGESAETFMKATSIIQMPPNEKSEQMVFFSNPKGVKFEPKKIKERLATVGIKWDETHYNQNKRDLTSFENIVHNFKKPVTSAIKAGGAGGIGAMISGNLGVDKLQSSALTFIDEGSAIFIGISNMSPEEIGGALCGLGYAGYKVLMKSKTVRKNMKSASHAFQALYQCTAKGGNQYWYDGDEKLVKAMKTIR